MAQYEATVGMQIKAVSKAEIESLKQLEKELNLVIKKLKEVRNITNEIVNKSKSLSNGIANSITEAKKKAEKAVSKSTETTVNASDGMLESLIFHPDTLKRWSKAALLIKKIGINFLKSIPKDINAITQTITKAINDVISIATKGVQKVSSLIAKMFKMPSLSYKEFRSVVYNLVESIKFFNIAEFFKKASDFTETLNYFSRAMRENTEEMANWQYALNKNIGLANDTLLNAQSTFKNFIGTLNSTLTNDQTSNLSKVLTEMALDYASLYNTSIEDAITKYQAALAGQVRPIRSTSGYDITAQTLNESLKNLGINKTVSQLTQLERRLVIVYSLTLQMRSSNAMEDFAKTIEQPAQQLKVLQNLLEDIVRFVGGIFYQSFAKLLPVLNGIVWALREVLEIVASLMGYNPFAELSNSIGDDPFANMVDNLSDSEDAIDRINKKIAGFDELNDITPTSNSGDLENQTSIALQLYDAIMKYNSGLDDIKMKARDIRDTLMEWLGFEQQINDGTLSWVHTGKAFEKIINEGISFINNEISKVFDSSNIDNISTKFSNFLNKLGYVVKEMLLHIDWFGLGSGVGDFINQVFNKIDWNTLAEIVIGWFRHRLEALAGALSQISEKELSEKISNGINHGIEIIDLTTARTLIIGIVDKLKTSLETAFMTIDVGQLAQKISDFLIGTIEYLNGMDWTTFNEKLYYFVYNFISNIDWNNLVMDTIVLIGNFLKTLWTVLTATMHAFFGNPTKLNSIAEKNGKKGIDPTMLVDMMFDTKRESLGKRIAKWLNSVDWSEVVDEVANLINGLAYEANEFIKELDTTKIYDAVQELVKKVNWSDIINVIFTIMHTYTWGKVGTIVNLIVHFIGGIFSSVAEKIVEDISNFGKSIIEWITGGAKKEYDANKDSYSGRNSVFNDMGENIKATLKGTKLYEAGKNLIQNIIDGINDKKSSLDKVVGSIKSSISSIGEGYNKLVNSLQSNQNVVDMIKSTGRGQTIKTYASGGYGIKQGQLYIANENGSELVGNIGGTNLVANQNQLFETLTGAFSDMLQNAGLNGNANQTINLNVDLDGKTIAKNTIQNINKMTKQNGYSPLTV